MGTLLHQIFQRMGIPPDEVLEKPAWSRKFMLQSMQLQLEQEREKREQLGLTT